MKLEKQAALSFNHAAILFANQVHLWGTKAERGEGATRTLKGAASVLKPLGSVRLLTPGELP